METYHCSPSPLQSCYASADCSASVHGLSDSDPFESGTNIVVKVLVNHNYQIYRRSQEGTTFPVGGVTTPQHCHVLKFPSHVPALPCLLSDFVSKALHSLHLDMAISEELRSKIESLTSEALENFGMKQFMVVTQVDLSIVHVRYS